MTAYGRPPTSIAARRERLIHRDGALTEARDAGSVAEGLRERRTENERDVLDRVVLVDVEIAVRFDREVEQPVVCERAEEVVVEADPGRDRGVAGAVDAERDRDVGLARAASDRDAAALAGTDLDVTERGRHREASWWYSPAIRKLNQ